MVRGEKNVKKNFFVFARKWLKKYSRPFWGVWNTLEGHLGCYDPINYDNLNFWEKNFLTPWKSGKSGPKFFSEGIFGGPEGRNFCNMQKKNNPPIMSRTPPNLIDVLQIAKKLEGGFLNYTAVIHRLSQHDSLVFEKFWNGFFFIW